MPGSFVAPTTIPQHRQRYASKITDPAGRRTAPEERGDKGAKIAKRVTAKKGRNSGKFAPKEFVAGPAAKIGKRPRCDNSRLPLLILSESIMQNPYLKYERSAHQGKPLVSKETIERKENQQPKNTKAHLVIRGVGV